MHNLGDQWPELGDDDFGCLAESGDDCPTEEIQDTVEEKE